MNNSQNNKSLFQGDKFNLRSEIGKYLKFWPWFLLSIGFFVVLGYLHLRYTTPVYSARASIIIKNDTGNEAGEAFFEDLGITGIGTSNFDNEIGIIQSKRLMEETVSALGLHIQYFIDGQIRVVELYENVPFSMQTLKLDVETLIKQGGRSFVISQHQGKIHFQDLLTQKVLPVSEGEPLDLGFAHVVFNLKKNADFSKPVIIQFSNPEKIAAHYKNALEIKQVATGGGLLVLSIKDPVKEKARDILDQLILEYNRNAIENKNLIAGNTANFINERLEIINGELDSVESGKEVFKEQNLLTDIQAQSQLFIKNASDYNLRRQEVETQLELSNSMLEYISSNPESGLLPTNLGITGSGVNENINQFNDLVLERNRILSGSSEKNPVVIRLNNNIEQIKNNVVLSLKTMKTNLRIERDDINRQASSIGSKIYAIPSKERAFRGIERQQNIKESLYLFLLQKREENSLAMAVTEPKAKVVDPAYYQDWPVNPNPRNIYLGTFVLGLFLPFSVFYLREILNDKVRMKKDMEVLSKDIALLGEIPKVPSKLQYISQNDRSILAESFRILITNLQYLLINIDKKKGVALLVTSTIKGEGKTFTSVNLGMTLANTGKKVLLMGADLRNPKLHYFSTAEGTDLGVTDYLVSPDLDLEQLIHPSFLHSDLDILSAGTIPPNPYELLQQEKMGGLISEVRQLYDYVIIDTAPSMMVADTFLLTNYVDISLYVVRSGYTEKEMLKFLEEAKAEGKFGRTSIVLNDLKSNQLGYGKKYGYGYGQEKSSFWSQGNRYNKAKIQTIISKNAAIVQA